MSMKIIRLCYQLCTFLELVKFLDERPEDNNLLTWRATVPRQRWMHCAAHLKLSTSIELNAGGDSTQNYAVHKCFEKIGGCGSKRSYKGSFLVTLPPMNSLTVLATLCKEFSQHKSHLESRLLRVGESGIDVYVPRVSGIGMVLVTACRRRTQYARQIVQAVQEKEEVQVPNAERIPETPPERSFSLIHLHSTVDYGSLQEDSVICSGRPRALENPKTRAGTGVATTCEGEPFK